MYDTEFTVCETLPAQEKTPLGSTLCRADLFLSMIKKRDKLWAVMDREEFDVVKESFFLWHRCHLSYRTSTIKQIPCVPYWCCCVVEVTKIEPSHFALVETFRFPPY